MANLLASYQHDGTGHDEYLHTSTQTQALWKRVTSAPSLGSWQQLIRRRDDLASILADHGVRTGADSAPTWALDPLPIILDEAQWQTVAAGLAQRAELHDALITDLYRHRSLLSEDALPAELILGHPGFLRAADGIQVPGRHQLFLTGTSVARQSDGGWTVIEESTDTPIGLGYALSARQAVARSLAEIYRDLPVHSIDSFYRRTRDALLGAAPPGSTAARVAVFVPGTNPPSLDQSQLADALGVSVVNAEDLLVADGRVWVRSVSDMEPVDVLLRQVPSAWSDPVDLYTQSLSGVPGLLEAAHSGAVSVINPVGAGVLENPALQTYLPQLARTLLEQDLLLPSTETFWCGERAMGSHVIANLHRLQITSTSSGRRLCGWELSSAERTDLAVHIAANPHEWVGQEPLEVSTSPTMGTDSVTAAPVTLRSFTAATANGYTVLPGGIGTVGTTPGRVERGGVAKDVWVLAGAATSERSEPSLVTGPVALSAGSAASLFRFGQCLEQAEANIRLLRASSGHDGAFGAAGSMSLDDVTAALAQLSTAALTVRDHLTPEAWRALAVLERPASLAEYLVHVTAIGGVLAESLMRDNGWYVLDLGRRLTRAEFLVDSISATMIWDGTRADRDVIDTMARLHDATLTHRRRSHDRPSSAALVQLLLTDSTNPRSLAALLDTIAGDVAALPRKDSPTSLRAQEHVQALHALLGDVDAALRPERAADGPGQLSHVITNVQWRLRELAANLGQWAPLSGAFWAVENAQVDPGAQSDTPTNRIQVTDHDG